MTDRGVSVALNYVIGLAITTILITGLLYAAGDIVDDRRESTTRAELRVVGQQVVADLMTADRLVQSGGETVVVAISQPQTVAGVGYTLTLNPSEVVLETADGSISITVPFDTETPVVSTTTNGGDAEIVYDDVAGELEVVPS